MTLRTLNYGNYGIFLIMGSAGFCPSTVLYVRGDKADATEIRPRLSGAVFRLEGAPGFRAIRSPRV